MSVRKAQNWDKLAIVLSVAVITLVLMVQTTFASGAASVSGAAVSSSPLAPATHTGDGDFEIADASEIDDDDFEIDDASDTPDGRGDKPIPPGQLKRRGIFGTIVGTDAGSVTIETKFGNVTVNVENSDDFEIGDRFTALLNRSPVAPDATDTTDGSFRTVTALRTKKIPGKSSRGHRRSVVVDAASSTDDEGTLTVLDDDGNEIVLPGGASGTLDGEDVILLIQQLGEGLPQTVLGGITSFSVGKRLEKLLEKGSPEKLTKLVELIQKRVDKLEARLQRIEDRAPAHLKDKVRGARDKSKGKGRNTGDDGDGGDKGKPDGKGKPDKDKPDKGGGGGKGKPDK